MNSNFIIIIYFYFFINIWYYKDYIDQSTQIKQILFDPIFKMSFKLLTDHPTNIKLHFGLIILV